MNKYSKTTQKNLPESLLEIESEITLPYITECRKKALKKISEETELPGFRKGKVPEKILVEKIGEISLLEDAAEIALSEIIPEIIKEEKLDILGRPEIRLTKIAPGNPVGFKMKLSLMPEINLPDYKEIAKKENGKKEEKLQVTEKEIDDAVKEIQKIRLAQENKETKPEDLEKKELPPLDDAFVKSLGNFKDATDFKEKLRENLLKEKMARAKDKKRLSIAETIVQKSKIDLPRVLIESELNKMEGQFRDDVERMGVKIEDYLKHVKKTTGDLRKDWEKDAEKRARLELILHKIGTDEKIKADEKEVAHEVEHLLEHYKDADPERTKVYIESILTKEAVFKFLEEQK